MPHPILRFSDGCVDWLRTHGIGLAVSTYQADRLFLISGRAPASDLRGASDALPFVSQRKFERPQGLCASPDGDSFWMSTRFQIWNFADCNEPTPPDRHSRTDSAAARDRLFVPRRGQTTGSIDCHDVLVEQDGRVVFMATQFGCLATFSEHASFEPIWSPSFAPDVIPSDRCHLNGLAARDGVARYVTACGQSNEEGSWRERSQPNGCVIDLQTGDIVCEGLVMPHSPRWHDGRLWLVQAGTGELGYISSGGSFEPVTFCPGFARGLRFFGSLAVVGISRCRRDRTLAGWPLDQALQSRRLSAECGLRVIDVASGRELHRLTFEDPIVELYDIAILSQTNAARLIGFEDDTIAETVTYMHNGQHHRWAAEG